MTYLKIILTIIALCLVLISCKLYFDNPMDVNIEYIGDRIIEAAPPINVRIIK